MFKNFCPLRVHLWSRRVRWTLKASKAWKVKGKGQVTGHFTVELSAIWVIHSIQGSSGALQARSRELQLIGIVL